MHMLRIYACIYQESNGWTQPGYDHGTWALKPGGKILVVLIPAGWTPDAVFHRFLQCFDRNKALWTPSAPWMGDVRCPACALRFNYFVYKLNSIIQSSPDWKEGRIQSLDKNYDYRKWRGKYQRPFVKIHWCCLRLNERIGLNSYLWADFQCSEIRNNLRVWSQ